jgi:hypothetical protein
MQFRQTIFMTLVFAYFLSILDEKHVIQQSKP